MLGPDFNGCIRVSPPLNQAEADFIHDLALSGRTLRGTPLGRGDREVPYARSAWRPCGGRCCLAWDGRQEAELMVPTLTFLVSHVLGAGAKAAGHRRFRDFTCDHVLSGVVAGRAYGEPLGRWVMVVDDRVSGGELGEPCESGGETSSQPGSEVRPRPANVIDFRPRGA